MDRSNLSLGLVHIYMGEGKGKTSAGMGLVLRALGRGLKVKIIQLFKRDTGEQYFFENSGLEYCQFKPIHPYFKNYEKIQLEALRAEFSKFWNEATCDLDDYDVVLIDEIGSGLSWEIIPLQKILDLIENKAECTELVFTGRKFPLEVIEKADYVSEVQKRKHPFDRGILARLGVEY